MFIPHFFAKSGEAIVTSELLSRGYNISVPVVDTGDDLYVVNDSEADLIRVQIKSANCKKKPYGFCGQVRIKFAQLKEVKKTPLIYIFALRFESRWHYLIISRRRLEEEVEVHGIGSVRNGYIWLRFKFYSDPHPSPLPEYREREFVTCSEIDFTEFLNWDAEFPAVVASNEGKK
jgi:hypothetical protein